MTEYIKVEKEVYDTVLKNNANLISENQHLKEVLIRCKDYLPKWITPNDILAEIDKLEVK